MYSTYTTEIKMHMNKQIKRETERVNYVIDR